VSKLVRALALISVLTTPYGGASLAAEDAASDVTVARGSDGRDRIPCGQVMSSSQQGADDYVATCEDGNRYRVFVNAEGRVIVQKLD
jgi:hypothetical protein